VRAAQAVPFGLAGYLVLRQLFGPILWPFSLIEPLLWWFCLPSFALLVFALARKRRELAGAHAVIALAWLLLFGHGLFPPKIPSARPSLRVLSFNLGADLAPPEQLVELLREVAADLVLLQELGPRQAAAIERELGAVYPNRDLHPLGVDGMGLLARHAILEVQLMPCEPLRAVQRALLDIEGEHVSVFNVHADLLHTWLWPFSGGIAQVENIAQAAARASPAILGGDFNATENMELYRRMRRSGMEDAFPRAGSGFGFTFPVFGRYRGLPLPPLARIDSIWYCEAYNWSAARVLRDAGSDHLPLLVELYRW